MNIKKLISCILVAANVFLVGIQPIKASDMPSSNALIWNAEFDGNDDTSTWTKYTSGDKPASNTDCTGFVADGVLKYEAMQISMGRVGMDFNPAKDVESLENISWETKFKYANKIPKNSDKFIALNGDKVVTTLENNKLLYGGTAGDEVNTGYEIKVDTWYVMLVKMNYSNNTYAVEIEGEDGTSYAGGYVSIPGTDAVTSITELKLPCNKTVGAYFTADYIRIWNEAKSSKISVTYEGQDFDKAKDMPLEFDFTVEFTEAINPDDAADITIDNGGRIVGKTVSGDKKVFTFGVEGLDYETEYTITVPEIGTNPSKKVKFTTEKYIAPDIKIVYGDANELLDGSVDMDLSFTFKVVFELPVTEADVKNITVSNDAEIKDVSLSADGKSVEITVDKLAQNTMYIVTVPEMGKNASGKASFKTYDDISYSFRAEFDGNDGVQSYQWRVGGSDGNIVNVSPTSEGYMDFVAESFSSNSPYLTFDTPIDIKGKEAVFVEARVKLLTGKSSSPLKPSNDGKSIMTLVSGPNEVWCVAGVWIKDGYMAIGGNGPDNATKTDFELSYDTWYTIRMTFNEKAQTYSIFVTDDSGEHTLQTEPISVHYASTFPVTQIKCVRFVQTFYTREYLDYIRIWDNDFGIASSNISNKEENVRNDASLALSFSKKVDISTAKNITVVDSMGNNVETEITASGKKVNVYFPAGLKYNEAYTCTVTSAVKSENGENAAEKVIMFTTEDQPFKITAFENKLENNKAYSKVTVDNQTSDNKNVYLLTAVYDSNSNLVKMINSGKVINSGTSADIETEVDVTGLNAASTKAFVWDGVTFKAQS